MIGIIFFTTIMIPVIVLLRYLYSQGKHKDIQLSDSSENSIDVLIYTYAPDVNSLDDVRAQHMWVYRETGIITGMEDKPPLYHERFSPTKENDRELSLIVRSALEVKRVTDKTVIYFFKTIRSQNIKSSRIRSIYDSINHGLNNNRPVVLRLTRSGPEGNDNV